MMPDKKFDLNSISDNFYADCEPTILEIYEFVERSGYPDDYKKIIFQEMLRAILPVIYKEMKEKYKNP
jgi:hypothetical protein